jgi:hypothetical protein
MTIILHVNCLLVTLTEAYACKCGFISLKLWAGVNYVLCRIHEAREEK